MTLANPILLKHIFHSLFLFHGQVLGVCICNSLFHLRTLLHFIYVAKQLKSFSFSQLKWVVTFSFSIKLNFDLFSKATLHIFLLSPRRQFASTNSIIIYFCFCEFFFTPVGFIFLTKEFLQIKIICSKKVFHFQPIHQLLQFSLASPTTKFLTFSLFFGAIFCFNLV